jgi:tape measure domain-containing protein
MADVDISLEIEAKKAKKNLDKINKELKDTGKNAKKAGKSIESSFKVSAGAIAAATTAVVALGSGLSYAVGEAIKFEDLETQFIAFTGSAEAAANQVERIAEFSASTPFQVEELANANRTLLAFGSSTEESFKQLSQLGEAAAATGKDIGELATIFGQIQVEGRLSSERFNQLAERGINLGPALAEGLGVAESQLKSLRAQGKISSEDVAKAFEAMTTGSGKFAGSMKRLSGTLSGALSTAEDNVDILAASIGKRLTPTLVSVANAVAETAKEFNKWISQSRTAEIARINAEIDELDGRLKKIVERGQDVVKTDVPSFLGTTVKEIKNAASQVDGSLSSIANRIEELKTKRDQLAKTESEEAGRNKQEQEDPQLLAKRQEIDEQLLQLSKQAAANRNAVKQAEGEKEEEILDERFAKIQEKLIEQQTARLELQGEFDEAEKLQVQAKLDSINAIEKTQREKAKKAGAKARADEINFEKIKSDALLKFEQQTWQERAKTAATGLSAIAGLQATNSKELFEIGKAAAIAETLILIPQAAQKAYTALAAFPPLAAAAAAATVVTGVARVNQIRKQKIRGFADGGLVEGGIKGVDSVPAMLTPGEVVVPEKSFADLRFNNEQQVFETRAVRSTLDETNGLLRQIASQRALSTGPSEDFLERKFSSTTPGGIFYEPVDDSLPEEEVAAQVRVSSGGVPGSLIARGELKNREQIRRGA